MKSEPITTECDPGNRCPELLREAPVLEARPRPPEEADPSSVMWDEPAAFSRAAQRVADSYGRSAPERRRRKLTVLFAACMAVVILATGSRWSSAGIASKLFFLAGMSLACVGALGRIWSSLYISGHKTTSLITAGPYSLCRNPLYFFSAVGMIGIGLTTETLAIPLLMVLFFAAYYPLIIRCEERRLAEIHPSAFRDYHRRIAAFWPSRTHFIEPESHALNPKAFRRDLMDSFWFVAISATIHVETQLESMYSSAVLLRLW